MPKVHNKEQMHLKCSECISFFERGISQDLTFDSGKGQMAKFKCKRLTPKPPVPNLIKRSINEENVKGK